ncbi:retrovirus-related pol polyprotein from transposon TNT 1-94 [Tanacetum coccineum]
MWDIIIGIDTQMLNQLIATRVAEALAAAAVTHAASTQEETNLGSNSSQNKTCNYKEFRAVMHENFRGFSKGMVDPTLFIRRKGKDILLVQIYVDDIIFASTTTELCDKFSEIMCLKFKMSMMSKILFFLGLQISQSPRGIFLNQSKYALESIKKYGMESCDPVDTPIVEKSKPDEDTQGKAVDPTHYCGMVGTLMYLTSRRPDLDSVIALTAFADADHAGCQDTRHSTSMRSQLTDYGLGFNKIPIYHFIKEKVENGVVELYFSWQTSSPRLYVEKELSSLSTSWG